MDLNALELTRDPALRLLVVCGSLCLWGRRETGRALE